jgi:hypothetical protein
LLLWEPDEGRHALIARGILDAATWRDVLLPHLGGRPYYDKPILFYWLEAVAFRIVGVSTASARLVSVFAALTVLIATYRWARATWDEATARWAVVILATAGMFIALARFVTLDMLLTCWVTLGILAGARRLGRSGRSPAWPIGVWAGLGLLTKRTHRAGADRARARHDGDRVRPDATHRMARDRERGTRRDRRCGPVVPHGAEARPGVPAAIPDRAPPAPVPRRAREHAPEVVLVLGRDAAPRVPAVDAAAARRHRAPRDRPELGRGHAALRRVDGERRALLQHVERAARHVHPCRRWRRWRCSRHVSSAPPPPTPAADRHRAARRRAVVVVAAPRAVVAPHGAPFVSFAAVVAVVLGVLMAWGAARGTVAHAGRVLAVVGVLVAVGYFGEVGPRVSTFMSDESLHEAIAACDPHGRMPFVTSYVSSSGAYVALDRPLRHVDQVPRIRRISQRRNGVLVLASP